MFSQLFVHKYFHRGWGICQDIVRRWLCVYHHVMVRGELSQHTVAMGVCVREPLVMGVASPHPCKAPHTLMATELYSMHHFQMDWFFPVNYNDFNPSSQLRGVWWQIIHFSPYFAKMYAIPVGSPGYERLLHPFLWLTKSKVVSQK